MSKTMCVIMGLAFLGLGILGLLGIVPMFTSDPIYLNIGEIVIGALGFIVGVYSQRGGKDTQCVKELSRQLKDSAKQSEDNFEEQKKENDRLEKELEQLKKENERLKMQAK